MAVMLELPPARHSADTRLQLHVLYHGERLVLEVQTQEVVELLIHGFEVPIFILIFPLIKALLCLHLWQLLNECEELTEVVLHLEEGHNLEPPVVVLLRFAVKLRQG